ncbi:MAG: fructosamine kinase family protein [Bdellovibrionales bacterium]|nr:fructosamine kinase family protein [Bdellovibrionales bacterium]
MIKGWIEQSGIRPEAIVPLHKSSFAETFRVRDLSGSEFFVKCSSTDSALISAEKRGLDALRMAIPDNVPEELGFYDSVVGAMLILPFGQDSSWSAQQQELFGKRLAQLHRTSHERFGFATDNFIGASPQKNEWKSNWGDFFVECRLKPQLQLGIRNGWVTTQFQEQLEELYPALSEYLNSIGETPSLCHGDLWSGNAIALREGGVWMIDPATYFGSRETDIAFMNYFGGFGRGVFEAYEREFPLSHDAHRRFPLLNLYHVMNHANLFGGGYIGSATRMVEMEIPALLTTLYR